MDDLIKCFRRERAGAWICVEPATLETPRGKVQIAAGARVTVGTKFMNIDLARRFDEQYSRRRARET